MEGKSCQALGRPDVIVQPHEVLGGRYPSAEILNVSEACKEAAKSQVKKWRDEDIANWEQLSNQACSARTGWVEIKPGTCSAGGPPPICVMDHWVRRPNEAQSQFDERNRQKRLEREAQLKAAACSCTGAELRAPQPDISENPNLPHAGGSTGLLPFVIMCPPSQCPPGYICQGGVCRTPTSAAKLASAASSLALEGVMIGEDTIIDGAKGRATDRFFSLLKEMFESKLPAVKSAAETTIEKSITWGGKVGGGIFTGLLTAKPTSLFLDGYQRSSQKIGDNLIKMKGLYEEWATYKSSNGRRGRFPAMIVSDMTPVRADLFYEYAFLKEYYAGVIRERELPANTCYEVFEFQHQSMMQTLNKILDLPLPSAEP